MILISTASRTSIAGLILFWLVYSLTNHYSGSKFFIKAMFVTIAVFSVFFIIYLVDWQKLFNYFWESRGVNYVKALPFLSDKNLWLSGVGFLKRGEIDIFIGTGVMDSYYLAVLLQTGLIGFVIFFGTVFIFFFLYFRDTRYMTRLHKLTGGIIALILFYGMLEGGMFFGHGPLDLLNWILIISCMNEKTLLSKRGT